MGSGFPNMRNNLYGETQVVDIEAIRRGVAQLVELQLWELEVAGSSPAAPTIDLP